jgi:hypothetical protein
VASRVLCKKKLNLFYKLLRKIGIRIVDKEYCNIFSSRRVIKNDDINTKAHYYDENIWELANRKLKEHLLDGITIYAEIVGFLPNGAYIQKGYDYGCDPGTFDVYVYRMTYTNIAGDVFEFSHKQLVDWCEERNINIVPTLYYDRAYKIFSKEGESDYEHYDEELDFEENFLRRLKEEYLEEDCFMCYNKIPAEGIVVRRESNTFDAYKLKSFRFMERETKLLDNGEENIEDNQ